MGGISTPASVLGTALQAGGQLALGLMQAEAIRAQSRFERGLLQAGARVSRLQEEEALAIGGKEVREQSRRTRRLIGAQRAAFAAEGIEIGAGSPLDIQEQTKTLGALDEMTIRNNAYRQAFGFRQQAIEFGARARISRISARQQARITLLTGALGAARELASGFSEFAATAGT